MEENYQISVLIPCHSINFLSESISSIQEQSLNNSDFEVVIVADRVDHEKVAEILEGKNLNYRIISSDAPGIVAALNTGLKHISSVYVARMDEDDVMYPNRLQAQLDYLKGVPNCVAVGGQLELIDQSGSSIGDAKFPKKVGTSYKDLLTASPVAHPAAMIRRSALCEIGGYRSFLAEDWDLWLRLREIGEVHNLSQKVIRYRIHDNQLSRQRMYAHSRARIIVGVSHFARLANLSDSPGIASDVDAWLQETIEKLRQSSFKFRLFYRWAKRSDLYQERFHAFITTKRFSNGLTILMNHPIFFLREILRKVLK